MSLTQELFNALVYGGQKGRRRQPSVPMRVGKATVGRILTMLIQLVVIKMLTIEAEHSTMIAVYTYMIDPDFTPNDYVDKEIFEMLKAEIDKSALRSLKAREAAARRKTAREANVSAPPSQPEEQMPEKPEEQTSEKPEKQTSEKPEEQTPGQPETAPDSTENAMPAEKPRPVHDPETIVSNYRPKKKPLPRYHVMTDEEMNAEPYDPFGARRAYEIQCGPIRRYHGW